VPDSFDAIFASLPDKPLLRVEEVAVFFDVTKRTIYSWYQADPQKLKGTNVAGVLRIYRQSVIDLVKANSGRKNNGENHDEVEQKMAAPRHRRVLSSGL
jgi:hypothetical protein